MKKLFFIMGVVFLMFSCEIEDSGGKMENQENNNGTNQFIGTWESQVNVPSNMPNKMVFTEDKMIGYDENDAIKSFSEAILFFV